MSSGWGCPHQYEGLCYKVNKLPCDPGMKGCVLAGRFVFADEEKNRPGGPKKRAWERKEEKSGGEEE